MKKTAEKKTDKKAEAAKKTTLVAIRVPLDDKEIVRIAKDMVEIRKAQLQDKKVESVLKASISEKQKDIDFAFNQLVDGSKEVEMKLRYRKNFDQIPPVMEYLDDKDNILKSDILLPEQYELEIDDWVVGEAFDYEAPTETTFDGTP